MERTEMKAVLITDMPDVCSNCQFQDYDYCHALNDGLNCDMENERDYLCPLKPVHALKSAGHDYIIYDRQYLYDNLEREYELMKKARDYESHSCN